MNGINGFDSIVMAFVQNHFHNAVTDRIFPFLTYLGEAGLVWIIASLLFLILKKTRRQGAFALCAIAAGFLLGEILLKNIVCRERPFPPDTPAPPLPRPRYFSATPKNGGSRLLFWPVSLPFPASFCLYTGLQMYWQAQYWGSPAGS